MRRVLLGFVVVAALVIPSKASADSIDLFQWLFNVDGTIYDSLGSAGSSTLPGSFSLTPSATGAQGLLTVTVTGAGAHDFTAFYDYDLEGPTNPFSDEFASVSGVPAAGLSWEVDEPGFTFGDIYNHVTAPSVTLDNTNAVDGTPTDDVSVALNWDFILAADQTATISILVSLTQPAGGFYITQFDGQAEGNTLGPLYYSTSLSIQGSQPPSDVPEPGSLALVGLGLAAFGGARRALARRLTARVG